MSDKYLEFDKGVHKSRASGIKRRLQVQDRIVQVKSTLRDYLYNIQQIEISVYAKRELDVRAAQCWIASLDNLLTTLRADCMVHITSDNHTKNNLEKG